MIAFDAFPKIDAHIHFNSGRNNALKFAAKYNFSLLTINTEVPKFPSVYRQRELAQKYRYSSEPHLFCEATVSTQHIFENGWAEKALVKIKRDRAKWACGDKF